MNLFRFDYDLTFAVLLMAPDGHTYSRYGTQDHTGNTDRMSLAGLKAAMREVLTLHRARPRPAAATSAPRRTLEDIPGFRESRMAKSECYHCHFAGNARIRQLRQEGTFTRELLYRYPFPENIGLTLDPDRNNRVRAVLPDSPAARAGLRPGDTVSRAGEVPVLTASDLQFALDPVADPGEVTLLIERAGQRGSTHRLILPKGWRRTDISWRPSQEGVPPQVGFWGKPLTDAEKRDRGIPPDRLGILVNFMFPGAPWARTRGDLRNGDVLVGINGQALRSMTTRQFHAHFRMSFDVGQTVTLNVLRGGQPAEVKVPCVEIPVE